MNSLIGHCTCFASAASSTSNSLACINRPIAAQLPSLRRIAGTQFPSQGRVSGLCFEGRNRSCHPVRCAATAAGAAPAASNGALLKIIDVELQKEAEQSYLAYAMSVIVGRALPDVRDGLKPVHRRILFAMHDLGLLPTKPYRKCARVVGEVLGKYHPHGDSSVYDALVKMAQGFSMRAPLVAGHGNFGSLDNDPPAAMRYTECRLQAVSSAVMLADLGFDTVDFAPNFDNSQDEPRVLPARVPNLLVNGSSGIAVSIATKIPPHNLREVVAGLHALIDKPDITIAELMQHIPAPDFPTGGEILASGGIREAYEHGKGSIIVRGLAFIEGVDADASTSAAAAAPKRGKKGAREKVLKPSIVITELPYQTNKADFVAKIAALVEEQKLTGISDVRDESDRDGMRVVVEVKRGSSPEVVLNNLYKQTTLQSTFPVNSVALVDGTPQTLNLKELLTHFLEFRCQVIKRRARFDLKKAQARQHIVEGLLKALTDLDKVVATVRAAKDGAAASKELQSNFGLSVEQSDAVLSMALRRLTSLEATKLNDEAKQLAQMLAQLQSLLGSQELVLDTVKRESQEIADKFADSRRTAVRMDESGQLSVEDVIPNRPSLLVFSRKGYIKRMPTDLFSVQRRGGRGVSGARMREDDTVEEVAHVMDHDTVLFFSPDGICRALKAYQIPQSSRTAAGTPLTQVLQVGKGARVASIMSLGEFSDDDFLVMLTKDGLIKRTPMKHFSNIHGSLRAIKLRPGDELTWVERCNADDSVVLASSDGMAIRFPTKQLTPQSRVAQGLKSMGLTGDARLVGMSVLPAGLSAPEASGSETDDDFAEEDAAQPPEELADSPVPSLLLVTQQGLGKRVPLDLFRTQGRGGKGLRAIKLNEGDCLSALEVVGLGENARDEEMLLTTAGGMMNRTAVSNIRRCSRTARGVSVANLQEGDTVQAITVLRSSVDDT
ncbi:DNA gyrase subunit A [Coccomyxa sp. Obi]|nr:DNA gyrase subunit A [Coccomyxa sp. Obi]